ncbi:hypothetical protein [Vacuolonema iberomarrocanum]|uniref:hypothetical protein n=1 Tax=Vacuolonema iberomarrocanum TaxID=3454632 RepID=UPI0019DEA2E3|nr:GNAT family N-acetyltransferase [filamentous cyanobacterium LEGE 07170]
MNSIHLFELDLINYQKRAICTRTYSKAIRSIVIDNKNALVDLFFDSFSDYHAQDEHARLALEKDLTSYFRETVYTPLLSCSWGCWKDEILVGACLLSDWKEYRGPLLDCIAVRKNWRSRSISSTVFQASIFSMIDAGQTHVYARISESNPLPMLLAKRIGFTAIE